MNIYEKLQNMRVELQQKNIKKTGKNKFAGYEYYELGDILPPINELQAKYKTCSFIRFNNDVAILTVINTEKPDEQIEFTSPMASVSLKGANDVQNIGALQTYQRRYLYMAAWEIVENDYFDCVQGKELKQHENKKITPKQLEILKGKYTGENLVKLLEAHNIDKLENLSLDIATKLISKIMSNK